MPGFMDNYRWAPPEPSREAVRRAAQNVCDERHAAATAELMHLCDWLGETWDTETMGSADEEATRAENIAAAVRAAVLPWQSEVLAYVRAQRANGGIRSPLTMFGERV